MPGDRLREAAQAALEMLEADPSGYTRQDKEEWLRDVKNDLRAALAEDALRAAALAQLQDHQGKTAEQMYAESVEQEAERVSAENTSSGCVQNPAENEHVEPVAWIDTKALDALRIPQFSIVQHRVTLRATRLEQDDDVVPLYIHPPRREWVGLTDAEISKIASTPAAVPGSYVHAFARDIEAALRERNHG